MKNSIDLLHRIAHKETRTIIGLMSGTSLDGLDIALCRFTGSGMNTKLDTLYFKTIPYTEAFKDSIRSVFSKDSVSLPLLCKLNPQIALVHAGMINALLKEKDIESESIDLIASHGQTIYHAPKRLHPNDEFPNATLQIGDGDHLAVATGISTISDFRQKDIACGGEGAPLAKYGDYLLCSSSAESRILLNIGGIANLTYLPASCEFEKVVCTDTGPGNGLMDIYVRKHFAGLAYDAQGTIAASGKINIAFLNIMKSHTYFTEAFPKTCGPEIFNLEFIENALEKSAQQKISKSDVVATLNKFSADTISTAVLQIAGDTPTTLYCSGGGSHNNKLIKNIKENLPQANILNTDILGINPDAKEAIIFALLANEMIAGAAETGFCGMGKISFAQ